MATILGDVLYIPKSWDIYQPLEQVVSTRPGKRLHKLWKITSFNGKTHYFYGHFQ